MKQYNDLYSPIMLGKIKVRNRIVLSPMGTRVNLLDGTLSDRCSIYLEERANGGAGLIIPEQTAVRAGYMWVPTMQINSDLLLPALNKLTASVHAFDSRILMQLGLHGGRAAKSVTGKRCIAPSAISSPLYKEIPEELHIDEIYELVEDWRIAALRAQRAGFDGVEVHGCHGYLINQFLSPATNRREDKFGGSLENRLYFAKLIINAIRESCGDSFVIGFKMPGFENLEDGLKPDDVVRTAVGVEAMGVDYLHVSATSLVFSESHPYRYTPYADVPSMYDEQNCLVPLAQLVKEAVSVPVIAVGGITSHEDADMIITEGKADMVAVGRPFLADAHWGSKPCRNENIRPCIGCMNCHKKILAGLDISCTVNPGLLREFYDASVGKTSNPQNVMIIGAGPGGMEAAIQASDRGHRVVIYDAGEHVGGALRTASKPAFKNRTANLLNYYEKEIASRDIRLVLSTRITTENIDSVIELEKANTVVVAVGGIPVIPAFARVASDRVFIAENVIAQGLENVLPKRVAVIGAGKVGLETAWLLCMAGKDVSVYDIVPSEQILAGDHPIMRAALLKHIQEAGVQLYANACINRIDEDGLRLTISGQEAEHAADCVVLALGYHGNHELYEYLRKSDKVQCVLEIGDCKDARGMLDAIHEGYYAGRFRI